MSLPSRFGSERGVFVPGLMGAGILLSIAMLVSDGLRRLFPLAGERRRAARTVIAARGRASDLLSVAIGEPPRRHQVRHVPRRRMQQLALGILTGTVAIVAVSLTLSAYQSRTGLLADRGWTLGFGFSAAGILAIAALVWIAAGLLGAHRPRWLTRVARWGPLGTLPHPAVLDPSRDARRAYPLTRDPRSSNALHIEHEREV